MVGKYEPLTLTPINFSLTEGTPIPAPLDSPPETPRPPTPGKGPLDSHPTPDGSISKASGTPPRKASTDSAPDSHFERASSGVDSGALSPASPTGKRPGSVRKFLGFHHMSSSDSLRSDKLRSDRPGSPATIASQPSLSRKKSGSWFKRKSSFMIDSVPEGKENKARQGNGVASASPQSPPVQPVKKGPPPPALPALSAFGVGEKTADLGAEDMFKDIQ